MRDICFRGREKGGTKWFEGDMSYLVHDKRECYIFPPDGYDRPDRYKVDPTTVGQYTGHKDKNGTKIFEGDIVKRDFGEETIGVQFASVEYRDSIHGFTMNPRNDWMFTEFEDCEVIGNIHDNLVLMEVKKC